MEFPAAPVMPMAVVWCGVDRNAAIIMVVIKDTALTLQRPYAAQFGRDQGVRQFQYHLRGCQKNSRRSG
jgi:hypothetical protein